MTAELQALGERAVKCKAWRWMPGMRTTACDRVPDEDSPYDSSPDAWAEETPDLSDPATIGCLLELVREAWGDPEASVTPMQGYDADHGWRVFVAAQAGDTKYVEPEPWGYSEAEALVAALEAAP